MRSMMLGLWLLGGCGLFDDTGSVRDIGPGGGVLHAEGATLVVPPNAFAESFRLRLEVVSPETVVRLPPGVEALTDAIAVDPFHQVSTQPLQFLLPLRSPASACVMYRLNGPLTRQWALVGPAEILDAHVRGEFTRTGIMFCGTEAPVDGGVRDAGVVPLPDAGFYDVPPDGPDAGEVDASHAPDAGGTADGGDGDASALDAELLDAGGTDSGAPDA